MLLFDHLRLQEMDLAPEVVREISDHAPKCLNERQVAKRKVEKVSVCVSTFISSLRLSDCLRRWCSRLRLLDMRAGVLERVQELAAARSLQVALARSKGAPICLRCERHVSCCCLLLAIAPSRSTCACSRTAAASCSQGTSSRTSDDHRKQVFRFSQNPKPAHRTAASCASNKRHSESKSKASHHSSCSRAVHVMLALLVACFAVRLLCDDLLGCARVRARSICWLLA